MLWVFKINFRGFRRFLIHGNSSYVVLYTQCLRYNICSAWFLDIRISTCFTKRPSLVQYYIGSPGISDLDIVLASFNSKVHNMLKTNGAKILSLGQGKPRRNEKKAL